MTGLMKTQQSRVPCAKRGTLCKAGYLVQSRVPYAKQGTLRKAGYLVQSRVPCESLK
jgi:hypothetical protein